MTLSFLGHRFDLDSRATAFFKNGELFQKLSGDKTTAEVLSNPCLSVTIGMGSVESINF